MYMYVEQSQFDLVVWSGVDLAHSRRTLVEACCTETHRYTTTLTDTPTHNSTIR